MVNKYFKALILTAAILAIGLFSINYMDNSRAQSISDGLESRALELQATQQLFFYESVFPDDDICPALSARIESQKTEAGKALAEIEAAGKSRLFSDSGLLKRKFILQNVELYLLISKAVNDCGSGAVKPVVYFYPDEYYCAECASQAAALDEVAAKCSDVRVFAFPTDLGIPVIDVLMGKYGVAKYPTLLFNGKKVDYIVSAEALMQELSCNPA